MNLKYIGLGSLAIITLLAGCKPKASDSVKLVPETERSGYFNTVNAQLELGGTLYGYVDVKGDVLKLAPSLKMIADTVAEENPMAAPFLKQDFAQILIDLGLDDVKAVGLSSVQTTNGQFRNRVYLHTPEGRRGLMAMFGGEATPFTHAQLAPADADVYAEADLDVSALYKTLRALVARVAGEPMAGVFESQLQKDSSGVGVKPLDVINSLKGRMTLVLRTDPSATMTIPGEQPFTIPAVQFLARVDGLGGSLDAALAKLPLFTVTQQGTLKMYTLAMPSPVEGIQPVIAVEGGALFIASNETFLTESLARTNGLAQAPEFVAALAQLGDKGNGMSYVSPRFFTQLRRVKELNPQLPAEGLKVFNMVLGNLPDVQSPLVSVRINQPEGVLYRSLWSSSLKQDVAAVTLYNPVTVGVMAAMAIPAFQKVRTTSLEKTIQNNLRQLDAAAAQFMLETGKTTATYKDLVGPGNDKYIRSLNSVAGEDYTKIVIRENDTELKVTTKAGKTVRLQRY